MVIKHLVIENFCAIEHLELDCSNSVNVFIGDNGAGKSTVLDAINILYSWLVARLDSTKGKGKSIHKDDIRIGAQYCFLSVMVEHYGAHASWSLYKSKQASHPEPQKQTDLEQLNRFVEQIQSSFEKEKPLLSYYGVNRNVNPVRYDKSLSEKKNSKTSDSFSNYPSANWKTFFNWFYESENEENRMKVWVDSKYHNETLDVVRACLTDVFPGYSNLKIEDKPTRLVIYKNNKKINFDRLSDGEKCYITLILDIARRLAINSVDGSAPLMGKQIVLIDEVDLHLHPSWQLHVIGNLERKFPNCQFFITSHSSLVLSGLKESGQLVVLRDGRRMQVSDIPYGDNGDYILKRFFSLNEVRNPEVQTIIDEVASELAKEKTNIELVERNLDTLAKLGVQFEESAKMRLQLAQKRKAYEKA
jgi:predicted ATP-binding protein involved in virulence